MFWGSEVTTSFLLGQTLWSSCGPRRRRSNASSRRLTRLSRDSHETLTSLLDLFCELDRVLASRHARGLPKLRFQRALAAPASSKSFGTRLREGSREALTSRRGVAEASESKTALGFDLFLLAQSVDELRADLGGKNLDSGGNG